MQGTLSGLVESCREELAQAEPGAESAAVLTDLTEVMYEAQPSSPGSPAAFPLTDDPQTNLQLHHDEKTVYQVHIT